MLASRAATTSKPEREESAKPASVESNCSAGPIRSTLRVSCNAIISHVVSKRWRRPRDRYDHTIDSRTPKKELQNATTIPPNRGPTLVVASDGSTRRNPRIRPMNVPRMPMAVNNPGAAASNRPLYLIGSKREGWKASRGSALSASGEPVAPLELTADHASERDGYSASSFRDGGSVGPV